MGWDITDDETRASFEVLRVADLPEIERADIQVVPADDGRPCACDWCAAAGDVDWAAVAAASAMVVRDGLDVLDERAIAERGLALGLADHEAGWLLTLFVPSIAITVLRGSGQFINGMHRTHALRLACAEEVAVY